jgi:RNA recognition motif-containing protein
MNIYIGNLPYTLSDDELRDLFAQFGEVTSATVIRDRETGRSKGFGFVEMSNNGAAGEAIRAMHDTELKGRKIVVNEARPREDRPRPRFGPRR